MVALGRFILVPHHLHRLEFRRIHKTVLPVLKAHTEWTVWILVVTDRCRLPNSGPQPMVLRCSNPKSALIENRFKMDTDCQLIPKMSLI